MNERARAPSDDRSRAPAMLEIGIVATDLSSLSLLYLPKILVFALATSDCVAVTDGRMHVEENSGCRGSNPEGEACTGERRRCGALSSGTAFTMSCGAAPLPWAQLPPSPSAASAAWCASAYPAEDRAPPGPQNQCLAKGGGTPPSSCLPGVRLSVMCFCFQEL